MEYERHYLRLIELAIERGKVDGYSERHHIVARCLGGSDRMGNLVDLTAREHLVAHLLLSRMHPDSVELGSAAYRMSHRLGRRITGRIFERLRERHSEFVRRRMSGRKVSPETKQKLSAAKRGKPTGRKMSDEQRAAIIRWNKTRIFSAETLAKMAASQRGKKIPIERVEKLAALNRGRRHTAEARANMTRAQRLKALTYVEPEEARRKRGEKMRGRTLSESTRKAISAATRGKPKSPEVRAKMSDARRKFWESRTPEQMASISHSMSRSAKDRDDRHRGHTGRFVHAPANAVIAGLVQPPK